MTLQLESQATSVLIPHQSLYSIKYYFYKPVPFIWILTSALLPFCCKEVQFSSLFYYSPNARHVLFLDVVRDIYNGMNMELGFFHVLKLNAVSKHEGSDIESLNNGKKKLPTILGGSYSPEGQIPCTKKKFRKLHYQKSDSKLLKSYWKNRNRM